MDKADKLRVSRLIHKIGLRYGLPDAAIKEIVESPYLFAHGKFKELELDDIKNEEELDALKTNYNFKALGKLYVNYPSLKKRNKQIKRNDLNMKKWKS